MKGNLTKKEMGIIQALSPEGAILWYSNKAMLHVVHPGKDADFVELGHDLIDSLSQKGLIEQIEHGVLVGEKYSLSPKGQEIAGQL